MSTILGWLLRFLSGGILDKALVYLRARADGTIESERIDANIAIEHIRAELGRRQAQRDILLAEQGRLITALMRPAFAYPLAVYYGAVIVDSLLHLRWNVAALPAPIGEWSGWIISAIFLSESGERITRTLANRRRS
jgi:hypothetical protein